VTHVIIKNIAASGAGQLVHVINNIGLLPVFLFAWGVERYGEWLVLVALPIYFSVIGDIGLTQVSGNDMTIKFAQDRRKELIKVFQSAWLLVSLLSGLVVALIAIAVLTMSIIPWIAGSAISESEATWVILCMLIVYFISFQLGTVQSALRAVGRYAEVTIAYHAIALLEMLTTISFLLYGAPPLTVAIIMTASRFISFVAAMMMLRHFAPWIRHGLAEVSTSEMWRLLPPSVAILGIPAGNAAMIQGAILILNHTMGPASVVLFSTTRTLTRFVLQFTSLFSLAAWPEISRLYGAGRADRLSAFLTHGTQLVALLTLGFSVVIILGAPLIFKLWTVGRIEADRALVAILMVSAIVTAFRAFPDTLIFATNRHIRYSAVFFVLCTANLAFFYLASAKIGLLAAAAVVAAGDSMLLIISLSFALSQIGAGLNPLRDVFTTRPLLDRLFGRFKQP
jgi:O-antigen/teichoic acid export membrane protein